MIRNAQERQAALKSAQGIVREALGAGREINDTEQTIIDNTVAEVKAFDAKREAHESRPNSLKLLTEAGGKGDMSRSSNGEWATDFGSGSEGVQYLDLGSKTHGNALVKAMQATRPMGSKALASSGDVVVGVPLIEQTPVEQGRPLLSFLQAIPTIQRPAVYSWLSQSVRTGGAEVVPAGSLKPTSGLALVKREGRLSVIATLSEPIDKFILEDNVALNGWVQAELTQSVLIALEAQILAGDGEGDNLTGLANTAGVQVFTSTAGNTDKLVEMRKALTKLETAGEVPSVFVMSPSDWEGIATKRNANGNFDMGGAIDAETRKAWGVPVALSTSLAANSYYLLGDGAAAIGYDSGIRTEWDKSQGFKTNEVQARTEGRFSLDVNRPAAILKGTFATA
jgi:HK97 family phage major capsid protein